MPIAPVDELNRHPLFNRQQHRYETFSPRATRTGRVADCSTTNLPVHRATEVVDCPPTISRATVAPINTEVATKRSWPELGKAFRYKLRKSPIGRQLGKMAIQHDIADIPRMSADAVFGMPGDDAFHSRDSYIHAVNSSITFARKNLRRGEQIQFHKPADITTSGGISRRGTASVRSSASHAYMHLLEADEGVRGDYPPTHTSMRDARVKQQVTRLEELGTASQRVANKPMTLPCVERTVAPAIAKLQEAYVHVDDSVDQGVFRAKDHAKQTRTSPWQGSSLDFTKFSSSTSSLRFMSPVLSPSLLGQSTNEKLHSQSYKNRKTTVLGFQQPSLVVTPATPPPCKESLHHHYSAYGQLLQPINVDEGDDLTAEVLVYGQPNPGTADSPSSESVRNHEMHKEPVEPPKTRTDDQTEDEYTSFIGRQCAKTRAEERVLIQSSRLGRVKVVDV